MKRSRRFVALAIVLVDVASLGMAATSASAQDTLQERRQIRRQQQLILQQQKQIQENQRQIQSQQTQIRRGAPAAGAIAPQDENRGLLGNIGNCPAGYRYSLMEGCLPAVYVIK